MRLAVLCLCLGLAPPFASADPGKAEPAATASAGGLPPLIDPAGVKKLLASSKGRPVLINVFASWCGPCKRELPQIGKLAAEHPKLVLVGLMVDEKEEDVRAFLPSVPKTMTVRRRPTGVHGLLPSLRLPRDWNESVPPGWEGSVPLTFVYDAKGKFATGAVGQLNDEAFAAIADIAKGH
jgi:thiol-disulfide isomerase/thioredoxin